MVLNATFNNILAISCRSVVLVEETGENQRLKIFVEYVTLLIVFMHIISSKLSQDHRDRMVVAFRTTCANSVLIAVPLLSLKKILKNIFIFISS